MTDFNVQSGDLCVGEGVELEGSVRVPGHALIHGTFRGELRSGSMLVGERGVVSGQVTVQQADVSGEVLEDISVEGALIVRSTGRMRGRASYGSIEIERGALLQGSLVCRTEAASPPAVVEAALVELVPAIAVSDLPDVAPFEKSDS